MTDQLTTMTVLRGLLDTPFFSALAAAYDDERSLARFLSVTYEQGCEEGILRYAEGLILADDNPFSRKSAQGAAPSERLERAFIRDLHIIFNALNGVCNTENLNLGEHLPPFCNDGGHCCRRLKEFYRKNGYGMFIGNTAFTYTEKGLDPIADVRRIGLDELKDYHAEKEAIAHNIEAFLGGLPALHMLLYGDKGTGKSSTVHAMLGKYFSEGLRMVEPDDRSLIRLGELRKTLAAIPLKFIIFIDDLSLDSDDKRLSSLKANLEGSLAGGYENSLIVATSNRRHLVKENFSDRQDAVHARDAMDEQLSLSDRFGLTVMFSTTDKAQYLSIVRQLAADRAVALDREQLDALAERWALVKGGRSPRRAKQLVDFIYARISRGLPIDF